MIHEFDDAQHRLEYASSGDQAIKLVQKAIEEKDYERYSLILVECKMTILDGYETTKQLKRMYSYAAHEVSFVPPRFVAVTCINIQEKL